jgi:hypothetical protein
MANQKGEGKNSAESGQGIVRAQKVTGEVFPAYRIKKVGQVKVRAPKIKTSRAKRGEGEQSKESPAREAKDGANDPVKFIVYSPNGEATGNVSDNAGDISGAKGIVDVIMMSGNWYVDVSIDGGGSWKRYDPTTIFPNTLGSGFCCDQIIIYVPSIERFIWYMQHVKGADNSGVFRLAVASSQAIKADFRSAWTFWDFRSDDFGLPGRDLDYPDMAFTREFLYFCTDEIGVNLLVGRFNLTELAAGGTLNFAFLTPSDAPASSNYGGHLAQNGGDGAFWAGHKDNGTLWVFSWPDASGNYSWTEVSVAKWPNKALSSSSPGGTDWLNYLNGFPRNGVIGAARSGNSLWLGWTASKGKGSSNGFDFPNAHIRIAEIEISTMKAKSEMQIWNNDYAFAYPALNVNPGGEVGIVLGWGGKNDNANTAVGILGDFVVWFANGSDISTTRWGDYVSCRTEGGDSQRFAGFGYFIRNEPSRPSGYYFEPYYVLFGRS